MAKRLLIVSNRLPLSFSLEDDKLKSKLSVGGLATGLSSIYKESGGKWIGWPGLCNDVLNNSQKEEIIKKTNEEQCIPVFIDDDDFKGFYNGFSNDTIWPHFHYFTQYTKFNNNHWESYKKVNKIYLEALMKEAKPDDYIWIQDYHLMLLPEMIKERLPDARVGFFLHIPFPSSEIFRQLPWREEILNGLIGADLIGFHTYDYVRHFLESVRRIIDYEQTYGQIKTKNKIVKVDAFPIGIDFEKFSNSSKNEKVIKEANKFNIKSNEQKIILTIDRLDYTKGIPRRLEAFDRFLEKYPEYHEKVSLVMLSSPSRTEVETYKRLKKRVDELVGNINGKYGNIGWTPVIYFYRTLPFEGVAALYKHANVCLVTPLRDGMNLVAKEFIAAKTENDGMLVLSETAGAAQELSEVITVNPNDRDAMADAIKEALDMPLEEKKRRNRLMKERISRYDIHRWADDFIKELAQIVSQQNRYLLKQLAPDLQNRIKTKFSNSQKRLLLLDYDGTLVGFAKRPEDAKPDSEVKEILNNLIADENNNVYIVSGRDRNSLSEWFQDTNVGIIAEHGVWLKEPGGKWNTLFPINNEWKDEIRPILQQFVDRTPGALLEEKDYSLVWHYRKVNPTLSHVRVNELKDVLINMTINLSLGILDGNKVIEIKNLNINKGSATNAIIKRLNPDFILAVGDDMTDEDMFKVLPADALSVRVGIQPSYAKYNLKTVKEVRKFLLNLTG